MRKDLSDFKQIPDAELIKRIQGKPSAQQNIFEEIIRRYQAKLYTFAFRMIGNPTEAEEMVQVSLMKAYENIAEIVPDSNLSAWLYKITRNSCLDYLRVKKTGPVYLPDLYRLQESDQTIYQETTGYKGFDRAQALLIINNLLYELPVHYREVIILRYMQHLEYKQIAEVLSLPLGTVQTHLARGTKLLKEKVDEFLRRGK